MRILLATQNRGKVEEQRLAFAGTPVELVGLDGWPRVESPEETGASFLENAVAKALYYHRATGLPAIGEDSGLEVQALGGEPGIHSARWLGSDTPYPVKNARILEMLAGLTGEKRAARFVSAVALADRDRILFEVVESCEGRIAEEPRGSGGFGYDPIFFYPRLGRTLAEVTPEEKGRVSHRGKSMARLRAFVLEQLDQPAGRALQ